MVNTLQMQKRSRRGGNNTQKNCTKKLLMTMITTVVFSLTQSQTSWNVKSSGLQEVSPLTKLVEVMNRFKGLDLINRVPEELWTEVHNIVQEALAKPSQRKRNARWQSGCPMRLYKQLRKEEKGKVYLTDCRVPENSKKR